MNFQQQNTPPIVNNSYVSENVQNVGNTITSSFENISSQVNNSMKGFSEQAEASLSSGSDVTKDFLESNTLFAKFAFVILIVIVFIFLLSLGIMLINYFLSPSSNPYIVKGMLDGNNALTVPQDPANPDSVLVERSNNEKTGLEYTWSVWLHINELNSGFEYQQFQHIFNKGNDSYDTQGIADVSNGPGLYLKQKVNDSDLNTASIYIVMDSKSGKTNDHTNSLEVKDIPLKKWVNVIIRMKNTLLEVYINGVVSGRLQFRELPMQNFYDVNVCKNGGINGKISNLRYYKEALTIFDINNIVSSGPDIRQFTTTIKQMTSYDYLSNLWYTNKLY